MNLELSGRPLRGEFSRIAKMVNTMVDQLNSFAAEVTRVAKEVLEAKGEVAALAETINSMTDPMDGMESTRIIRGILQLRNLPIICLTAKAMKGDRDQCL